MSFNYSVLIPAYNCQSFIIKTISSALNQTLLPCEIIIIDDCSTDDTYNVIAEYCKSNSLIRLFKNDQNLGVALTRNNGLSMASGDYVAFLDADDLWLPTKMERQLNAMQLSAADFSYTAYSFIDKNGDQFNYVYSVPDSVHLVGLLKENCIGLSSAVITANIAKNYHMQSDYMHEDFVFWLSLLRDGKRAVGIIEPLMQYRLHNNNRSSNKIKAAKSRWRVYRKFLKISTIKSLYYFVIYSVSGILKQKRINY